MDKLSSPLIIPYSFAKRHGVMVSKKEEGIYDILHLKQTPLKALVELKRILHAPCHFIEASSETFQKELSSYYESRSSILEAATGMEDELDLSLLAGQLPQSEDLLEQSDDAPVIRLINALFTQAIKQQASDIHIETYENQVLVRHRIDGVLHQVLELQRTIAPLVISRIKVMAKLDIAEKRIPQDGRISIRIGGHTVDVRVSTLPSNHGERIVLRLLDQQSAQLNLNLLGLSADHASVIKKMIAKPHGILLVTGPTGSGKTTSLYAMLSELNEVSRNILTIEDPIEYDLAGIGQTQVNTKVDMTFAKGLRAILRQDPDVVMIGEIRDLETAEIAIQASLTGHLVLSTLHTNSAIGALTRLRDMGVESFLLASSIVGLIAQRLVRRLCPACKAPHPLRDDERELMGLTPEINDSNVCNPVGCEACNGLGYRGRTAIYELILVDECLQGMIHRQESSTTIETYIRPDSKSLRQDGFERVLTGETSLAEILRVTSES